MSEVEELEEVVQIQSFLLGWEETSITTITRDADVVFSYLSLHLADNLGCRICDLEFAEEQSEVDCLRLHRAEDLELLSK